MAIWKKVITSGSAAQLSSLTLDTDLGVLHGGTGLSATSASAVLLGTSATTFTLEGTNGTGQVLRTLHARGVFMSGSFSGSFFGDGSGLTGVSSAPIFKLSGSNTGVDFNAAVDTLSFTTASVHGFNLSLSTNGTIKTITLGTPQDLRTTSRPTFAGITGGQITGSSLELTALPTGVDNTVLVIDTAGNVLTDEIDPRDWGTSLIDGAGSGTRVAYFSDADSLTSDANFTFGSSTLTVNGSTFGQNVVIAGDLTVNGTTTNLNVTNANVEDRFILLNSGSATGDGGIIVQTETTFSGSACGWDDSAQRGGFQFNTP